MDRRTVLKNIALSASAFLLPRSVRAAMLDTVSESTIQYGWYDDQESLKSFVRRHRYPFVAQQNQAIKGTGKGKSAFLHLAFERVTGKSYVPHRQGAPDCVSQAAALGVDFLSAVQIVLKRMPQRWITKAATEPIYGGSRVEIGNPRGPGSTGHWAAEWLVKYGVLLRQPYPGDFDFTVYDAKKAIEMGKTGCPDALEPIAKLHPVKETAICTSYADLCDLIYNGSPVMVCSNVGFGPTGRGALRRDSQGFLTRKRGGWSHAMLFAGYDDEFERPGALCFNSWGDEWITGPTRGPQPPSTFWIDANTVDSMLRAGDSFAFSAYVGFPRVNISPYVLH